MTRRRIALYIAIGCLAYAVALIVTLPASWISAPIGRLSTQLVVREPDGTAWAGSGRLYLRLRSGGLLDLGALRWNASPWRTLSGRFAADFSLGDANRTAHVEVALGSTAIRDVNLTVPGQILADIVPGLEALGPQGTLQIRSENLRIDADAILGMAEVGWRPAQLAVARGLVLGSHFARLRAGGGKVDIEFGTTEGPLRLSGGGTWSRNQGLAVSGTLEHGENAPPMTSFLQGICSNYRGGRCTFRFPI